MIKVRRGVFETNSSSAHSIVVTKKSDYYTHDECTDRVYINDDGIWNILWEDDLDFGRYPFKCLCDLWGKAMYAIADRANRIESDDDLQDIYDIIKEIVPEFKKVSFPIRREHHEDVDVYFGNIDHQSEGLLGEFLRSHNVTLKEFLTNKRYIVIIDGDEYNTWGDVKRSGVVDMGTIDEEFS